MKHARLAVAVLSLLLFERACSALVQEVSSIRPPAETLTIATSVGCSSLVRSSQSLSPIRNVDVVFLKHLQAYRLVPRSVGAYQIGPVQLLVFPVLPKPDTGFGFYYSPGRLKYPFEKQYFENMAAHGMNTVFPQANQLPGRKGVSAPERIAQQVNTGVRVGLIDQRFPVICYSMDTPSMMDVPKYRDPRLKWPELVVQSIDEPNADQMKYLQEYQEAAHKAGIRIGTACAGYGCTGYRQELPWCSPENVGKPVPGYGHLLDIWIVSVGTLNEGVQQQAIKDHAEIGSYMAYDVKNAPMMRWTFGLYAWKTQAKTNLVWAYIDKQAGFDYSRVIETPKGPLDTESIEGLAEGIVDYRVLQAVSKLKNPFAQKWLHEIEQQTTLGWWPRGYVKDHQDEEMPTMDMSTIRRRGLRFLSSGG